MEPPYLCPNIWVVTAGCIEKVPENVRKIDQTQAAYTALVVSVVGNSDAHNCTGLIDGDIFVRL